MKAIPLSELSNIWSKVKAYVSSAISGLYTKPLGGIPKSDLSSDVQTSLSNADTALQEHQDISGKQDVINDLAAIRSGASAGSTALQPNDVPSWAKQSSKPSYTASEVGALPDTTKYAGSQSVGGAANKAISIPFGQVDATSTNTAFTATVNGITELSDGVTVWLKNGVVKSSTSRWTLNINGLGAKYVVKSMQMSSNAGNTFDTNYAMLFVFDATQDAWMMNFGYYSDNNDTAHKLRAMNSGLIAYNNIKANILLLIKEGKLLAVNETGGVYNTSKTLTTESFDPFGGMWLYSNGNTPVASGGYIENGYLWNQQPGNDARNSFNITTTAFENGKPVYLVATPQSDGTAKLYSTPLTQTLPSTEDGLIYIQIGIAHLGYQIDMYLQHPIYYFKDGALRQWTNQDTTALKLGTSTIGGATQGIFLNQGVPTACDSFEMQYVRYIASLYGATRNEQTGLWTYKYSGCARWDDTNEVIMWDRYIGYDDITDDEMKDMVKCRLHALQGVYGVGSKLSSRIAFGFAGYGNNQGSTSPQAYVNNHLGKFKTYGYVGVWGAASGGQYYSVVIGSEFQLLSGLRHYIGRSGNSSDQTLPNVCVNLEYITITFGKNSQKINLAASPNLEFVSIMYIFVDNGGKNYTGCTLILHPDVYAKIFDSTNADYTLWHKIDVANQARTNPITIQSA